MKHTKLLLTIVVSCYLSITFITESRAQVLVQNFDNAVGTFFPDPPTTNQDFFASNPAGVFALSNYSTDSYEGSGSMKIDYNIVYDAAGGWIVRTTYNVNSGNTSLPYIDLSSGNYLSLWYKVLTPANFTESGTIHFEFKLAEYNDAGDRELWLHVTTLDLTDNSGTWKNVLIPLKQDADNTKGFFLQIGYIDGALQLDKIKGFEIAIGYQTTASAATGTGSLLLDNLQLVNFIVCPLKQGDWKNNPDWPVAELMLGTQSYSQSELVEFLSMPVGRGQDADASLILAKQLIAAKLNIANDVEASEGVQDAIESADDLIGSATIPMSVKPRSTQGKQMTNVAGFLESFNKGELTEGCSLAKSGVTEDNKTTQVLPNDYVLDQNFPNPFNPTTQISFGIPQAGNVTLKIYNSVGQLVKTLVDGNMSKGYHQVTWDATDNSGNKLSSGVYFYRITAGTFTQVNKMMLLK